MVELVVMALIFGYVFMMSLSYYTALNGRMRYGIKNLEWYKKAGLWFVVVVLWPIPVGMYLWHVRGRKKWKSRMSTCDSTERTMRNIDYAKGRGIVPEQKP